VHWNTDSELLATKVYGFYYVAVDGNTIITMNSVDASQREIEVREASALSIRPKG
jgi:hypothetical protein